MFQNADLKAIKEATAKLLNLRAEELDYVTEDLIQEYRDAAQTVDGSDGDAVGTKDVKHSDPKILDNWGTYGNSVTYDPGPGGKIYWKQNAKGTSNYGCGTAEPWSAGKEWGRYVIQKGGCGDGRNWYFIGNYQG
jgi:hypothetical protein